MFTLNGPGSNNSPIAPPLPLVLVPSDPVSVPNASAYMVSVGDVTDDVSKTQITFDVPRSADNSIVIYGVEAFNMRAAHYNGLREMSMLTVELKSKNGVLHKVILFYSLAKCITNKHTFANFI